MIVLVIVACGLSLLLNRGYVTHAWRQRLQQLVCKQRLTFYGAKVLLPLTLFLFFAFLYLFSCIRDGLLVRKRIFCAIARPLVTFGHAMGHGQKFWPIWRFLRCQLLL